MEVHQQRPCEKLDMKLLREYGQKFLVGYFGASPLTQTQWG